MSTDGVDVELGNGHNGPPEQVKSMGHKNGKVRWLRLGGRACRSCCAAVSH